MLNDKERIRLQQQQLQVLQSFIPETSLPKQRKLIYKEVTRKYAVTFLSKDIERSVVADQHKKESNIHMSEKASDVIFVGNKPPMSYVLAIITAFSSGAQKEITLKARGQAITTAVDVAEITRSRFIKELKVEKIAIGTAEMPPREGESRSRMVSTIEITLSKA